MHVTCHVRRRIHACHVSYEEEDTHLSLTLVQLPPTGTYHPYTKRCAQLRCPVCTRHRAVGSDQMCPQNASRLEICTPLYIYMYINIGIYRYISVGNDM